MNGLPAILLSTRGTPIVSGEVVDRLGASEEGILLGAPLSHSLLACEYAIRVLLAAADPSLRSQLVTGHSSVRALERSLDSMSLTGASLPPRSQRSAHGLFTRASRAISTHRNTRKPPKAKDESIPRTAFLFPGALDWLDGPAPYLEKLKIVLALARTVFAFAHLTRALSFLEVKVDGRSAGAIPKITESLAFDLASAIDFCPELVVLIDDHVATRNSTTLLLRHLGRATYRNFDMQTPIQCSSIHRRPLQVLHSA